MSRHTHAPGPWVVAPKRDTPPTIYAFSAYGGEYHLATVHYGGGHYEETIHANARLIAASPAMYSAITEVIADIQDHFNEAELYAPADGKGQGSESLIGSWRDKLRAALPKGAASE